MAAARGREIAVHFLVALALTVAVLIVVAVLG